MSTPHRLAKTPVRLGTASWQLPLRALSATLAGLALLVLLVTVDLATGDFTIGIGEAFRALVIGDHPAHALLVRELRLPQATVAVLAGAALGLSGALTQTFARNPLASPDILGVTQGASLAAVLVIIGTTSAGHGGGLVDGPLQRFGLVPAAFAGGIAAAGLLWLLARRRGLDPQRLVLTGIAVSSVLTAGTQWLLVRASINDAASAQVWLYGNLNGRGWDHAVPVAVVLATMFPLSLLLGRHLNAIQLGHDTARGLGVRLPSTQLLTLLAAVLLAAAAVSAVGPLGFVAFVVPQIALRLTGGSRPPLVASMVYGACLVVTADLMCRTVLPPGVPAGVVTACVGAPYLIWLLIRTNRRHAA
ncbi:FecCD family ABC transporter permease [Streptomyces sp. NPDC127068]|uniref:FecCD family ABC transporter permease n=1 Tax=Streptomyces sp. NPDC127068 TaxID=3347127 RepID=UPI0036692360